MSNVRSTHQQKNNRKTSQKYRRRRSLVVLIGILVVALILIKVISGGNDDSAPNNEVNTANTQETVPQREYNIPPASEENDLLKIARGAQGSQGKVCYLTFDDGPTKEVTPKVLDVLKQHDVKATFFCLGKMLDANRDIAERAHKEGHMLANHSYNHNYNQLYATKESFMEEINKTQSIIEEISGKDTLKLMRFPGGSYNAGDHAAEKQVYKGVLKDAGFYYVDWNCLNGDAEAALRDVSSLVAKVKNTSGEDNIVVLMHDAAAKTTTPQALGEIIEYLKGKGFEFKRLDEVEYYDTGKPVNDPDSIIL